MKKIALVVLILVLTILQVGCKGKENSVSNENGAIESVNSDNSVTDKVTDDTDAQNEEAHDSDQARDLILSADALAYKLIFEDKNPIANDMGTYVHTINGYELDNVQYKGKSVKAIQLFWQCEDGKSLDYASWFTKEQWAVILYYDKEEFIDIEAFPCEYDMVISVLSTIKLIQNEDGVNLTYDIYFDKDYSSLVPRDEYRDKWNAYTAQLGSYVRVKNLLYHYKSSFTYPYVTLLLEFEKGDAYYTFYFKPGTLYIFNVISGLYNDSFHVAINPNSASYIDEQYWLDELNNYKDSAFDLTEALTGPSLKDSNKNYFKLGVGIYGSAIENCAINSPEYMIVAKKHFNSVTMTNLMKPSYILDQEQSINNLSNGIADPVLTFNTIDNTLQWCLDNGVQMRGHTLIWHAQTPDWFFKEGYQSSGELVDRETMQYRMESYIRQYLAYVQEKYPGVIYCWDVVNEAVEPSELMSDKNSFFSCRTKYGDNEPNLWYEILGQDYVELAFTYARKYAADGVSLFYNDYGTIDSKKLDNIYRLCEHLKQKGLIDGIGMQGYWGISSPTLGTLKDAIYKYTELGLEIHITELSIDVEAETDEGLIKQANRYASIMRLLQTVDTDGGGKANITSVTFFGLMDGYMLYDNDTNTSRLFDKNLQKKLAFNHIMETFLLFY
ncbi:MAG: endo-1,4-beta-xylanase [Clostridiales bacterium]|nr:endo-1,4-beta-xylanase [Clostridiales bacterium]